MTPLGDGRVRLHGQSTAADAAVINAALAPLCHPRADGDTPRTAAQRRHDALTDICARILKSGDLPDVGGEAAQVVVTIDWHALLAQVGPAVLDTGQPVSPAEARRLACAAGVLPAVLGGGGQVLDVGAQRRVFTGVLRRALVLRDRGCAFPSCDRPATWCDGHHIVHWAQGGATCLAKPRLR